MVCLQSSQKKDLLIGVEGSYGPGPFVGKYHYPILYLGNKKSPDMTLIAAAWCPDGFAIVADGFRVEADQSNIYDAQKIFQTSFSGDTGFACACIGESRLTFESGDYFDFVEATQRATNNLAGRPFPSDPADYFAEVGERLFQELAFPEGRERLASPFSRGFAASRVVFAGYGNGTPIWTELVFSNTGTRFAPPDRTVIYPLRAFMVFAGSNTVYGDMQTAGKLSQPLSLQEAIDMVHEYASTCIENNTSIEDCANFKGHIHLATVMKGGFEWKIEPKNPKK
jgi:hypothetical protein